MCLFIKPLLVYITCIAQYMAPVIQSLLLLDRSGSLQPERSKNDRIYENSFHIDPTGFNVSAWPREEDGEHTD